MTVGPYPNASTITVQHILDAVPAEWKTGREIWLACGQFAHVTVRHVLRDLAMDGEVECKVDKQFQRGKNIRYLYRRPVDALRESGGRAQMEGSPNAV